MERRTQSGIPCCTLGGRCRESRLHLHDHPAKSYELHIPCNPDLSTKSTSPWCVGENEVTEQEAHDLASAAPNFSAGVLESLQIAVRALGDTTVHPAQPSLIDRTPNPSAPCHFIACQQVIHHLPSARQSSPPPYRRFSPAVPSLNLKGRGHPPVHPRVINRGTCHRML